MCVNFRYGFFLLKRTLSPAYSVYLRLWRGHAVLCFLVTHGSRLHCRTVGPRPALHSCPSAGDSYVHGASLTLPLLEASCSCLRILCHPNIFIMAEAQPESPARKNREEIHVLFVFKLLIPKVDVFQDQCSMNVLTELGSLQRESRGFSEPRRQGCFLPSSKESGRGCGLAAAAVPRVSGRLLVLIDGTSAPWGHAPHTWAPVSEGRELRAIEGPSAAGPPAAPPGAQQEAWRDA